MWITPGFLWISLCISGKLDGILEMLYPVKKKSGCNPAEGGYKWQN
jgi:hypothetical protein